MPADCVVNHGNIEVDQAALTGESLPVSMHQGEHNAIILIQIVVTATFTAAAAADISTNWMHFSLSKLQ